MQLVVPSAVRNAVSAATITFTASSMILCFFIISSFLFCHTDSTDFTDFFRPPDFLRSHRNSQKSQKFYVLRTFIVHRNLGNNRFALCAQPVPKALSVISVNFCVTIKICVNLCHLCDN